MPQFAPTLPGYHRTLFAVDFQKHRLTLLYFIELVSPVLLQCLRTVFPEVKDRRVSENVLKLDVKPHLFQHDYPERVRMRECVMCLIFEKFLYRGWRAKFFTNVESSTKRNFAVFEITGDCVSNPHVIALCTHSPKRIILENGNQNIVKVIEGVIQSLWRKGLKYVKRLGEKSFVFKFHSDPWTVNSPCGELIDGRNLMINIFKRLHEMGYYYYTSGHPGSSKHATDTVYFIKTFEDVDSMPLGHTFALGLLGGRKIYLINTQPEIRDLITKWIHTVWKGCDSIDQLSENCYIFRLTGSVWTAKGKAGMIARYLLLRIFEELKVVGYRLHAALNLMHDYADLSTFFLTKSEPSAISCVSVSFNRSNEIRFANAQEEIVKKVRDMLFQCVPHLEYVDFHGFPQIRFGTELVHCIGGLLIILESMKAMGCHSVTSADLSSRFETIRHTTPSGRHETKKIRIDLNTWIFETTPAVSYQPETEGATGWDHKKSYLT